MDAFWASARGKKRSEMTGENVKQLVQYREGAQLHPCACVVQEREEWLSRERELKRQLRLAEQERDLLQFRLSHYVREPD
jgi:hypothetical protein